MAQVTHHITHTIQLSSKNARLCVCAEKKEEYIEWSEVKLIVIFEWNN